MEEYKNRLLIKYNSVIQELEEIDDLCKNTLQEAELNGNYSEADMALLSVFARDNNRRLQFARAERDLINKYQRNAKRTKKKKK